MTISVTRLLRVIEFLAWCILFSIVSDHFLITIENKIHSAKKRERIHFI